MGTTDPALNQKKGLSGSTTLTGTVLRLVLLALIDGLAIWFIYRLIINTDSLVLPIVAGLITLFANIVILRNELFPIRWMLLGLILMAVFAVYPILFTVNVSLTNFGFGHLLTKDQAIEQLEKAKYLPEGAGAYSWTAFVSDDDEFTLWLQADDGSSLLAKPGTALVAVQPGEEGVGDLDAEGTSYFMQ